MPNTCADMEIVMFVTLDLLRETLARPPREGLYYIGSGGDTPRGDGTPTKKQNACENQARSR